MTRPESAILVLGFASIDSALLLRSMSCLGSIHGGGDFLDAKALGVVNLWVNERKGIHNGDLLFI